MTQAEDNGHDPVEQAENESGASAEAPDGQAADEPAVDRVAELEGQLAERTADLQRLQAEYANYKRRVDRDRELDRQKGREDVLVALLTVLDDIGRAEEHGELTGGFKAVADALWSVVGKYELAAFGAEGEPFDPELHEAVFHAGESAEVQTTSIGQILRIGYKVGDKVVRAATVGVVDPASESEESDGQDTESNPATDD